MAGVHADRLPNRDDALSFITSLYMKYGAAIDAVVVEMEQDHPDHRRVIHRVGQGRAWWE